MPETIKFLPKAPKELKKFFCRTIIASAAVSSDVIIEEISPDAQTMRPASPNSLIYTTNWDIIKLPEKYKISGTNKILRWLLTDPRMRYSWKYISKHCSGLEDYNNLWNAILFALRKSNIPAEFSVQQRDELLLVAKEAKKLAKRIINPKEMRTAEGLIINTQWVTEEPFNRLIFEFFPNESAQEVFREQLVLMGKSWASLKQDQKNDVAFQSLSWWPGIGEVLWEYARWAEKCANETMFFRKRGDWRFNNLIRHLAPYFRKHFKGPMEGTLYNIASVVFQRPIDEKIDTQGKKDFVGNILRHQKGGA